MYFQPFFCAVAFAKIAHLKPKGDIFLHFSFLAAPANIQAHLAHPLQATQLPANLQQYAVQQQLDPTTTPLLPTPAAPPPRR